MPRKTKYIRAHFIPPSTQPPVSSIPPRNPGSDGAMEEARPHDSQDFVEEAVSFVVSAVSLKETASSMANEAAAKKIIAEANSSISTFIDDDICPRWPKPGPPPPWWVVSEIAAEVTLVANSLAQGALRTSLAQVASGILDKFAQVELNPQPLPPGEVARG